VAVGAWLLHERGAPTHRVAERSTVLFLLTSAMSVVTLMLIGIALFVGLLLGSSNPLLSIVPGAVGAAMLAFFLALPSLIDLGAHLRAPGRLRTVLTTAAAAVRDTRQLLFRPDWRILGAVAYLWCDIGVLMACLAATGNAPPVSTIVLAYLIGSIASVVPIPGGVGILDAGLVGMLVLYGVAATPATATTLVYHGLMLWIPGVWGTVAFVVLRRTRNRPLRPRPSNE